MVQDKVDNAQVFKWEKRKAWDILLGAYLSEFTGAEPVELYLLTHPFHGQEDFERQAQAGAGCQPTSTLCACYLN